MSRVRDPIATRKAILEAGFEEIYLKGFQASSVNNILKKTQLTKGAFFHHFKNKLALGYAVVDEILYPLTQQIWIDPFNESDDTIAVLEKMYQGRIEAIKSFPVNMGCPVNNLVQEMSPIDEGFRIRVQRVLDYWISGIAEGLKKGQSNGRINSKIDPQQTAYTIVSLFEGLMGLGKNSGSVDALETGFQSFRSYLRLLKAETV